VVTTRLWIAVGVDALKIITSLNKNKQTKIKRIKNKIKNQGEMYDWEGQFVSQNDDIDVYQQDYDSDD
jgi:hypothetical protein